MPAKLDSAKLASYSYNYFIYLVLSTKYYLIKLYENLIIFLYFHIQ